MRRIAAVWILLIFSLGMHSAYANIPLKKTFKEPKMQVIPFKVRSPQLSEENQLTCERRAGIGAKALQNAKGDVKLKVQLQIWDRFALSQDAEYIGASELAKLRDLIEFAWTIHEQKASITPNQYGNAIFAKCYRFHALSILT